MIAQALNVYKTLIGSNAGDIFKDVSPHEITANVKYGPPSDNTKNESSTLAKSNDGDDSVFLLHSVEKEH
ncbi:hypothetical protein RHGRI_023942 [Rhododendron griersonianum]|uniref:Uncharacterized protein n=1 Tax=Rhododendron griersonianum TaxID=479676 RepID=A0AAV6J7P7_9ERIC|nr:hypothetical protein RHGRI_023942 [Rhododendron griersonianum]